MGTDLAACPRAHVNSGSRKRSVSIMWPLHPEASGAKRWGCSDPSPSARSVWVTARRGACVCSRFPGALLPKGRPPRPRTGQPLFANRTQPGFVRLADVHRAPDDM